MTKNDRDTFKAKLAEVRSHTAATRMYFEMGDLPHAYAEAEAAQHAAFDVKSFIDRMLTETYSMGRQK